MAHSQDYVKIIAIDCFSKKAKTLVEGNKLVAMKVPVHCTLQ